MLIEEMRCRGYNHNSKLDHRLASGIKEQSIFVDSRKKQKDILRNKRCNCKV
jgi:hypothetical protein